MFCIIISRAMKRRRTAKIIVIFVFLLTFGLIILGNYKSMENHFEKMSLTGSDVTRVKLQLASYHRKMNETSTDSVNVMFVMTSLDDTKEFPVQLKSILYHRTSPLFLHVFVTDDVINLVMTTLLDTWQADFVFYRIYRVPSQQVSTDRVIFTINLLRHLPSFVTEVVYMDSKIFFLHDVKNWLQKAAYSLPLSKLFLVDDQHCDISREVKCNVNLSLMYINLNKVGYFGIETLLNQKSFFHWTDTLPCKLSPIRVPSENDKSGKCFAFFRTSKPGNIFAAEKDGFLNIEDFPDQFTASIKESIATISAMEPITKIWKYMPGNATNFFGEIHQFLFKNMSVFSRKLEVYASSLFSISDETERIGVCKEFLRIAYLKRRTHLFFHCGINYRTIINTELSANPDVTLLTISTLDRVLSLEKLLLHWRGPAAVLFYITDYESIHQLPQMLKSSKVLNKTDVLNRIAIHLVYQRLYNVPINYLRNVLLNNTMTSHYFYVDVDLVPIPYFYENIIAHLKITLQNLNKENQNKVWVVPAFETFVDLGDNFPSDKQQLLKLWKNEIIIDFKKYFWPEGHRATNYTKWKNSTTPYKVNFRGGYEPYILASRSVNVTFNENLMERMLNKISYVQSIYKTGHDFYVLPNDFLVHLPHPLSQGTKQFLEDNTAVQCGVKIYSKYTTLLNRKYPGRK